MYTKLKTYKENILVPRNLDGRQNKLKQEAIKILSQETIEGNFQFEPYMIDIPEELVKVKTINGDFYCSNLDLIEFPKWFSKLFINGNFYCSNNLLTSLKYCPQNIKDSFYCPFNKLISLEGCPQTINGSFYCPFNELTTLEGCLQTINGNFDCSFNQLISLEGCPKIIKGAFWCNTNKIKLKKPEDNIIMNNFFN